MASVKPWSEEEETEMVNWQITRRNATTRGITSNWVAKGRYRGGWPKSGFST
jgi:hypothetical protein